MKQNGSLCSVIAGNLAEVSLATQTWFLTEDKERWCCCNAAAQQHSHPTATALIFLFSHQFSPQVSAGVIIVTRSRLFISHGRERRDESRKSEMFLVFTLKLRGREEGGMYSNCLACFHQGIIFCNNFFPFLLMLSDAWSEMNKEDNLIWH